MRGEPVKVVSKRSRDQLRKQAYMLRKTCGLEGEKKFPVMEFLELIMPKIDPLFVLEPVEDEELVGRAAETFPDQHRIRVKQSIYDAACSGHYWSRFVMAHELGHYVLHGEETVAYAYPAQDEKIPRSIDAEKQADDFASELLAPVELINEPSEFLVSKHFGVPLATARIQMNQADKIRERHRFKRQSKQKKNG